MASQKHVSSALDGAHVPSIEARFVRRAESREQSKKGQCKRHTVVFKFTFERRDIYSHTFESEALSYTN